jgi:hypothetical protein
MVLTWKRKAAVIVGSLALTGTAAFGLDSLASGSTTAKLPVGWTGNTAVGTTSYSLTGEGNAFGSPFTQSTPATSTAFRFYAKGGQAPQTFSPGIYAFDGTKPTSLIAATAPVTVPAGAAPQWFKVSVPGINLEAGTTYFLALLADPQTRQASIGYIPWGSGSNHWVFTPTLAPIWPASNLNTDLWDFALDWTASSATGSVAPGLTPVPAPPQHTGP